MREERIGQRSEGEKLGNRDEGTGGRGAVCGSVLVSKSMIR